MCRWAAYAGEPIFLEEIVSRPEHSLISQSLHSDEGKTDTNGDGFGVAWYGARPNPGSYRDTYPAWSDPNLASLAQQVKSGLFLAHVRASTGSATSRNNCHPFVHENWSFMHNGMLGGYNGFRKQVDQLIPDAFYENRKGATDSEAAFLIALGMGWRPTRKRRWSARWQSWKRWRGSGAKRPICALRWLFLMASGFLRCAMRLTSLPPAFTCGNPASLTG